MKTCLDKYQTRLFFRQTHTPLALKAKADRTATGSKKKGNQPARNGIKAKGKRPGRGREIGYTKRLKVTNGINKACVAGARQSKACEVPGLRPVLSTLV